MSMRPRLRISLVLPLLSAALASGPLHAQCGVEPGPCDAGRSAAGEATTVAVNALLGGMTGGLLARHRGGSFRDGFVKGAAGGALTYAGKRVAVEDFDGAGLLGRQVAAVGASVSHNAAAGRPALARVVLPLGPVRVYLSPWGGEPVRAKVDLAGLLATGYFAARSEYRLDLGESLSAGAPVFLVREEDGAEAWHGAQLAGVVLLRDAPGAGPSPVLSPEARARIAAHERVHVLQYDQAFLLWAAHAEAWAMGGAAWSRGVHRYVDLGLHAPVWAAANAALPYESRPWEREAFFLSRTSEGDEGGGPILHD